MIRRRMILVAGLALLTCLGAERSTSASGRSLAAADSLPGRISDAAFWQMITEFSEPSGYFFSDNFMSNENSLQYVIPELQRSLSPGGVYIGVGPEQNFTYIAALQPQAAFIIDIRRQNMLEHLLYKALIETSSDRAEFVSRLFSRTRVSGVGTASSVEELFSASRSATPSRDLFEKNLQAVQDQLINHHRFALVNDDLNRIEYVYKEFYDHGPDMSYSFPGAGPGLIESFPAYAALMTETDAAGEHRGYLATEESFRILKALESNNLVIPLVGDFTGPKAVRTVGRYLKEHGATVTAFYTSNVEMYLHRDGSWNRFCDNVATLPLDTASTFIRTVPGRMLSGQLGLNPELANMAAEVKNCSASGHP
jgi:hypothetical protein